MSYKNFEVPVLKGKNKRLIGILLFTGMVALFALIQWILDGFVWRSPSGYVATLIIALLFTVITVFSKTRIDTDKGVLFVRNINHPFGKKLPVSSIVTITETKNKAIWGWVDGFVVRTSDGKTVKASVADLKGFVGELKNIDPNIGVIKG